MELCYQHVSLSMKVLCSSFMRASMVSYLAAAQLQLMLLSMSCSMKQD